ncbi:MAG: hypothetical protein KKG93_15500 [Bacteroidetes bacterium]|nr:hypothetical protein [Bacteroidota bacterium]
MEIKKLSFQFLIPVLVSLKEFLPKLFHPFTQEEQGYSRSFEGNGLGLAFVKGFCEISKAEIEVVSTKGRGTTFTIKFNQV